MFDEMIPAQKIINFECYDIAFLDKLNNKFFGQKETAGHIVSLSGGLGSAFAAERAIQKYGRENIILYFADVKVEDPDLYRFLHDLMKRWGGRLYWYTDGRTPQDVWTEKKIIPNSLIAPCTYELKIKPFRQFIKAMEHLPVIYIGFKNHETKRQCNTIKSYADAIPEAVVEYPLLWEPVETRKLEDICESELGIELPLMYKLGYDYNNCGGTCCRSGKKCFIRTLKVFPKRFAQLEAWENEARSHNDARSNRSFYGKKVGETKIPITLCEIREAEEIRQQVVLTGTIILEKKKG